MKHKHPNGKEAKRTDNKAQTRRTHTTSRGVEEICLDRGGVLSGLIEAADKRDEEPLTTDEQLYGALELCVREVCGENRQSIVDDAIKTRAACLAVDKNTQTKSGTRKAGRGYPSDPEAIAILTEARRRKLSRSQKYEGATCKEIFETIIEEGGIGSRKSDKQKSLDRILLGAMKNGRRERTEPLSQNDAAEAWGKRLSAYILDHPKLNKGDAKESSGK